MGLPLNGLDTQRPGYNRIQGTLSIAFGNADKYFRSASYEAYFADDWRVNPNLTLNIGLRWEYASRLPERRLLQAGSPEAAPRILRAEQCFRRFSNLG
jgi:outer membrane receptor protein involved in Fe transport